VQDNELVVRGERKRPELADGTTFAHVERGFGAFERRIRVPRGVDADHITASLDDGVLSLIVPKPEQLKPKTIPIGSGTGQRELETTTA
jgi:HSP20 family protein